MNDIIQQLRQIEREYPEELEQGKSKLLQFLFYISPVLIFYGTDQSKPLIACTGVLLGVGFTPGILLLYQYEFGLAKIFRELGS